MMGRSRHLREAGYGDELRMPARQTEKLSGNCGGSAADAGADFIKFRANTEISAAVCSGSAGNEP